MKERNEYREGKYTLYRIESMQLQQLNPSAHGYNLLITSEIFL